MWTGGQTRRRQEVRFATRTIAPKNIGAILKVKLSTPLPPSEGHYIGYARTEYQRKCWEVRN